MIEATSCGGVVIYRGKILTLYKSYKNKYEGCLLYTSELLAPAGSYEALEAAFSAGADAVYIGGSQFGARAYADNLDEEKMCRAIDLAHLQGKKLYLTVNTLSLIHI